MRWHQKYTKELQRGSLAMFGRFCCEVQKSKQWRPKNEQQNLGLNTLNKLLEMGKKCFEGFFDLTINDR